MRYLQFHTLPVLASAMLAGAFPAAAQLPGNASLSGTYFFRYLGANTASNLNRAVSALGSIVFDGNGGFQIQGQQLTSTGSGSSSQPSAVSTSGKYSVLSSGLFSMDNKFATAVTLFGGIGTGAVVASSTDSAYCDLFVAIPASNNLSSATLSGTYNFVSMEFLNGDFNSSRDTFFPITADGRGGLGNVNVLGTAINLNSAATMQTSTGATYSVSANGSGTMTFPAPSGVAANNVLISGAKTLYVSGDGNFILGGSASSYDMFLAVKTFSGTAATAFSGLYFTGLLYNDSGPNGGGIYASDGVANEVGKNNEIAYERSNYANTADSNYDYAYTDSFPFGSNGVQKFPSSQYALSPGGSIAIGSGLGSYYQLNVYVKAPALTGTGVFLNPQGAQNAASNAPFAMGVSQGEFMTLYGSGLASNTVVASSLPFPTTLGNVQVTMNGVAMPIYYVSPTAISAIVPYSNTANPGDGSLVTVQVNNNQTNSNSIQLYSSTTSPGIFTLPPGGIGSGAILDAHFNVISATNPAKIGDTVQIFLTGLGPVTPAVAAGSAAPSNPLSNVVNPLIGVNIDGQPATILYQGLAPGLAGLYQLNVTIPTGVTTNADDYVDIETVDASSIHATIRIGK